MKSANKIKPIHYSKLGNTQILSSYADTDDFIPDQHQSLSKTLNARKNLKTSKSSKNNKSTSNCNTLKTVNYYQINAFNRTFATVSNDPQDQQNNKKLTHGLTTYKDIKTSHMTNSTGRDSIKISNKSNSKLKTQLKLEEQCFTNAEKQAIQCTFTPKTNSNVPIYKNFKDFVNFQENFLTKKQEKIKKLKEQQIMRQSAGIKAIPQIDQKSRKISDLAEGYQMDSYGSLKKIHNKTPVFQRLYNIPRKRDRLLPEQGSFIPKILSKSKTLVRTGKVQDLLYEDAQRRKQQQLVMKTSEYKKQQQQIKFHQERSHTISVKQNKTNCKLICNKIKNEFIQLLQNQCQYDQNSNQYGQELPKFYFEKNQAISPILAVTVISELFNVQLNPNKNQQLCCKVIDYLICQQKSQAKETFTQYVETIRLWEFVKAILGGMLAFQKQPLTLSPQQIANIHQDLGYFYSMRLTKQNTKLNEVQAEQQEYKIQTSEKTNRLAQIHRAKKLQKLTQFISQTKIQSINKILNYKQKNNNTEPDEKVIRLEDLFILDQIRKRAQLQQKRIKNEQLQLNGCSFRPSLNEKSIQKAKERKNKSRQHLKTVTQFNSEKQQQDKQNIKNSKEKGKKIIIKGKINQNKALQKENRQIFEGNLCQSIKNVDKTLLRLNIARKMRDIQQYTKQRGYKNISQNWLKQTQDNKKKAQGQIQKFLGYQQKNIKNTQQNIQNTQNTKQMDKKYLTDIR